MATPKCPACGAKFSHDQGNLRCRNCGLPDEIRHLGAQTIARWKRKTLGKKALAKRHPSRRRKAHGRQ